MADPKGRGASALAGAAAMASGLAAGHLVAALSAPAASPMLAIGRRVIDATPEPVKQWAIASFGTSDKAVLISGVVLVSLGLGALLGLLARRSLALAVVGGGVLALVALLAALGAASTFARLLPASVAFGVAALVLTRLLREPASSPAGEGGRSRRVVLASAATGGTAVVVALLGEWLTGARGLTVGAQPTPTPPVPVGGPTPLPSGLESEAAGLSPLFTPAADFYRIDIVLGVPNVDANEWRLSIDGMVDHPFTISWPELVAMDAIERDVTLACVSNTVGGDLVGSARWRGVPTAELLRRAGVQAGADQVLSRSVEGFSVSTPVQALTDGRGAMLAFAMNGAPLPPEHGFPVRLLTPGLYGFVGATKWITSMTLTTYSRDYAYWTQQGWATDAPIRPSSRIELPRGGAAKAGPVKVGGVAWAHGVGVGGVQVRVDGGPWQDAVLGPDVGIEFWRQWVWTWAATVGVHTLQCRVLDADGRAQDERPLSPFPSGASGLHSVRVTVAV